MKKYILGFISALILIGLIYVGYKIFPKPYNWERPAGKPFIDVKNSKTAVICYWKQNYCDYFTPSTDSGSLKVLVTVDGKPGKEIEVNLWTSQKPGGSDEFYTKYTDDNGVAFFEGITSGTYYPNYNLNGFPKEYGNAYTAWETQKVEVIKGTTKEVTINLSQKQ